MPVACALSSVGTLWRLTGWVKSNAPAPLLAEAALPPALAAQAEALARKLVAAIQAKGARSTVSILISPAALEAS